MQEALAAASDALKAVGIKEARLDAEVLLEHATGWDRARIAANPEVEIPPAAGRRFGEMVRRRLRREPVAYIVGRKGFRRIELAVDARVLIPRPETELLVELALELAPRTVLDVGTGSGAIALAIADELPGCDVTATDASAAALQPARANAERLGLADRVRFLEGTIPGEPGGPGAGPGGSGAPATEPRRHATELAATVSEPAPPTAEPGAPPTTPGTPAELRSPATFDLVVANLPYIAEPDWDSLAPEVTQWEPRGALLAGPDGLDAIRELIARCGRSSRRYPAGTATSARVGSVALEVGDGQAAAVGELLRGAGFDSVQTRRDLAGIERVVWGSR